METNEERQIDENSRCHGRCRAGRAGRIEERQLGVDSANKRIDRYVSHRVMRGAKRRSFWSLSPLITADMFESVNKKTLIHPLFKVDISLFKRTP